MVEIDMSNHENESLDSDMGETLMQIVLDIPESLVNKLNELPNPQQFLQKLLTTSLESRLEQDEWWLLLENIENIAVDTGIAELSEQHDRYLGKM